MKMKIRYNEDTTIQVPAGHVAAKVNMSGVEMIALPESLFEITDAYERFSAAAEYLKDEFSSDGIAGLLFDDAFMATLEIGVEGDVTQAAMDVEDEL